MARCEVYAIKSDGTTGIDYLESPSWAAMMIWTEAWERYGDGSEFSMFNMQRVWDLARDPCMKRHERLAMLSTFDGAYALRGMAEQVADALDAFGGPRPDMLTAQARNIRTIMADPENIGVCWNQTSIVESPWEVAIECTDCGGTGEVRGKECETCDGAGRSFRAFVIGKDEIDIKGKRVWPITEDELGIEAAEARP